MSYAWEAVCEAMHQSCPGVLFNPRFEGCLSAAGSAPAGAVEFAWGPRDRGCVPDLPKTASNSAVDAGAAPKGCSHSRSIPCGRPNLMGTGVCLAVQLQERGRAERSRRTLPRQLQQVSSEAGQLAAAEQA